MKEGYIVLLVLLGMISLGMLIAIPMIMSSAERDNMIRAEGMVVDMKQEQSGHFLGDYDYFVQLNTSIKWYQISEKSYWIVEIGDYIIIYESKRVEIK